MEGVRQRILNDFPYPIAYPYSLIFDESDKPSNRCWALCFTEYQLLRVVCLPLVSQYLREEINRDAAESISALNKAVAGIRSPFFSDWIVLINTLRRHLAKVGIETLFPALGAALDALKQTEDRSIGLRGNKRLNSPDAILALRNETAHGGLPDQAQAGEHLGLYLPVLHQVLEAFDFLGDTLLKVHCGDRIEELTGRARVCTLRGAQVSELLEEELSGDLAEVFSESPAVIIGPKRKVVPIYPLFKPVGEPLLGPEGLFLYDGHYGIQVQTPQGEQERSYIYYLGVHHRGQDTAAGGRLKELLAERQISFFLEKEKTAPWTIADSALDYSRRTLEDLLGNKYFPECYLPSKNLEHEFEAFLRVPDLKTWSAETQRRRYVNGFILTGFAGGGKTAFLARQVEGLLKATGEEATRENPNLVLFLRGNAITVRSQGLSLFRDLAERLGIAVEGASTKVRKGGGFSIFRELLDHFHRLWKQDRVEGRRLILIFDALNEAPLAEKVIREALEMAGEAACYPWCKVVFSVRQEWLGVWAGKMGAQETSPLEELRPFLYTTGQEPMGESGRKGTRGEAGPPVVTLEPFSEAEAAEVYGRYQAGAGQEGTGYKIPACRTPWGELTAETRSLLTSPLYLHLFMVTFDAKPAEPISKVPALFKEYVETSLKGRPGLQKAIDEVVSYLLQDVTRASADLSDNDCNRIREEWTGACSVEEARVSLSPVEALAHEGIIRKRVREEGGGYRFVFQTVAEYLVYRCLVQARQPGEQELSYWIRRAGHDRVFAEYAGAFGFLLRDWGANGSLALAAGLVEASPDWLRDVLTGFLVQQAHGRHVQGTGSSPAEAAAQALEENGGGRTALALGKAASVLMPSQYRLAALAYFQACGNLWKALQIKNPQNVSVAALLAAALCEVSYLLIEVGRVEEAERACRRAIETSEALYIQSCQPANVGALLGHSLHDLGDLLRDGGREVEAEHAYDRSLQIFETLYRQNPQDVGVGASLAETLNDLGLLLRNLGRVEEAEHAYGRSVEISRILCRQDPENMGIRGELGRALKYMGVLLRDVGRVGEAERAYERSVEISDALYRQNPENVVLGHGLGNTLDSLGILLRDAGRAGEAERAFQRSVEIYEALYLQCPENVGIGHGLGSAMDCLGGLLREVGRTGEAERAYQRSAEISEALYRQNPENVGIGRGLGGVLNNLGLLLHEVGRVGEAERAYQRSVEISEALYRQNPENVGIGAGLGMALNNLGNLLREQGRAGEAERAYQRSAAIYKGLYRQNPENVGIGAGLKMALDSLGNLFRERGRTGEAERAYQRSVEISEALYRQNPENVGIGRGLGGVLNNLGLLLHEVGRAGEAERAYQRSVEISEALYRQNPENVGIGAGLGTALNNLGNLVGEAGRAGEAERAYQRSAEIYKGLYRQNPENVVIGAGLKMALDSLGNLLREQGRTGEAERAYQRSVEISEALYRQNPENVGIGRGLGGVLNNLGLLLHEVGRASEAERAYQRSVEISEALYRQNPENVGIGAGLGTALNNLGNLVGEAGRAGEAERAYQRSVEIYKGLYRRNPENVNVMTGYARSLCSMKQYAKARKLVDEVLAVAATHPYANLLAEFITKHLAAS